jgi:ABC-type nickel/cobalt efflux system permease component RcnA
MSVIHHNAALPSAWEAYLPLVTSLVRTLLATAGGVGFTWAMSVTADQAEMAVSAAMIAAAAIWSFWQKVRAMQALRTAAENPPSITAPKLPA